MENPNIIHWRLPFEKPMQGSHVIIETLDGDYIEEWISDDEVFDIWDEAVIRWAYLNVRKPDDFDFSKYMNLPKDDENVKKVLRDDFNLHVTDKINNSERDSIKYEYKSVKYTTPDWERESRRQSDRAIFDKWVETCMDGFRSWVFKSDKDEDKGTSNEADSSESESVSDEKRYKRLRNMFYYHCAGERESNGKIFSRSDAVKTTLEYAPELEAIAKGLDPWYFDD